MLIYKISDLIVFKALKSIKYGFLEIKKTNGEVLKFGNPNETLKQPNCLYPSVGERSYKM